MTIADKSTIDHKQEAAIKKKSFELNYHDGAIWCEHLDGMGHYEDEVIATFLEDKRLFQDLPFP